jgi:hypothetical protein
MLNISGGRDKRLRLLGPSNTRLGNSWFFPVDDVAALFFLVTGSTLAAGVLRFLLVGGCVVITGGCMSTCSMASCALSLELLLPDILSNVWLLMR